MTARHPQQRRQQRLEALCAATLRALGSDAGLHYRGRRLWQGEQPLPVPAPHLRLDDDDDNLDNHRALADGVALRLRHSDAALHHRQAPPSAPARLVFAWLEQLRVESLAPATLPGMARNLATRFQRWSDDVTNAGLTETDQGLLLFSLAWTTRVRLAATAMPERVAAMVEHTRAALAPVIGADLAALRHHRRDQNAYAVPARRIAQYIGQALESAAEDTAAQSDAHRARQHRLALLLGLERGSDDGIASLAPQSGRILGHDDAYRVFTRAYDEERPLASLLRAVQLKAYRARLDRRIADQGFAVRRVARRFAAHFARRQRQGWSFNEESGYLDGRRLATLVTSPTERRLFRREAEPPRCDGVVGILLDCSGSMRAHAEAVAVLVDRLCTALSLANVDSEILGFTTTAWHGGRALKDWQRPASPASAATALPGRLNERRHLLIKSAEQPWRRARQALGGLLKADLYKEGLDGEALDWACQRLLRLDRQRRVLLVFSDGAPMDTATHQHNGPGYLDEHLRRVRQQHERHDRIAIRAVGVGLDLSPFYPRNLPVNLAATLDNALLDDIARLITS